MSTNPTNAPVNTLRNTLKRDFAQVPNALLNDFSIHPLARLLFTYMAAQREDFIFYHSTLQKAIAAKSEKTLAKYLKMLIKKGWLSRDEKRVKGRFCGFDYTLHAYPTVRQNLPDGKKTGPEKNRAGKNDPLNNTVTPPTEEEETTRTAGAREDFENEVDQPEAPSAPTPSSAAPPSPKSAAAAPHATPDDPHFPYNTGVLNDYLIGGEAAFQNVLTRVTQYHRDNPEMWKRVCRNAKVEMSAEEYRREVEAWISHHISNRRFFCEPTRNLQRGRASLWDWLSKSWRQAEYNPTMKRRAQAQQETARATPRPFVRGKEINPEHLV